MMNKRLLLAGMAAALSISAAGVPVWRISAAENIHGVHKRGIGIEMKAVVLEKISRTLESQEKFEHEFS